MIVDLQGVVEIGWTWLFRQLRKLPCIIGDSVWRQVESAVESLPTVRAIISAVTLLTGLGLAYGPWQTHWLTLDII